MALNIKPANQKERALVYIKTLLNNTDNVTKVADHSTLDGHAQGVSKIAGKSEKDIILALSQLFPENTYGDNLDICADVFGVGERFGSSQSSTYIRIVADPGTAYLSSTNIFNSKDGIQFQLESDIIISNLGFTYAKVRSIDVGEKCNVNAGTINSVSPEPTGHLYVINEYKALYGRDVEQDDIFRRRIKDGSNVLATHTIAMLEQVFMKINNNVLRVFAQGLNENSQLKLAIVTQNGIDLFQSELDELLNAGNQYFGLSQLKPFGRTSYGIVLSNIIWQPIDMSFRVDLTANTNVDDWRKEVQIRISKYLDFRYWQPGIQKVEWDNLLEIVKSTPGTRYCADEYFYPNNDVATDRNKLPRLRSCVILNLNGQLLSGIANQFNPVFYPNQIDWKFNATVLSTI